MNKIEVAISYLKGRGAKIPAGLIQDLNGHAEFTSEDKRTIALAIKAGTIHSKEYKQALSYQPIRSQLWSAVYDAVEGYLLSTSYTTTYREPMSVAVSQAYLSTADIAYEDGGGSLPLDEDTLSLAQSFMNSQLSYIDNLFETLKQLRKDGDFDAVVVAFQKANSWSDSLDGFYNMIKLAGAKNKMLTFTQMKDTKESCDDCIKLRGERHRASWWISHEYVPPKGSGLACSAGGHCGDVLVDDNGVEFTI